MFLSGYKLIVLLKIGSAQELLAHSSAGDVEDSVFILPLLLKVEPNAMTKPVLGAFEYGSALISGNNHT